ncbi:glutathione S-transferase family protein [Roseomonas sp. CCTCC AB2023176]|uniref:glutathione S-transferase family protein n=1 Tax=Roseomonas sp. CCTCC AB2023176 TaxID=3342640 RepID=UPI0035D781FD
MTLTVHGWGFSPYVRAVRAALNEKRVPHEHRDMTPADLADPAFRAISPFGKVPVLRHGDLALSESIAILHYVDEAFPGPSLVPEEAVNRARMRALLLGVSAYLYPTAVMGVFFGEAYVQANGGTPDAEAVHAAASRTAPILDSLESQWAGPWAVGEALTLADLLALPMIQNLAMTGVGRDLIAARPRLSEWFARAAARPSLRATEKPIPLFGLG